ncbi:AAA family ATPase [Devosia sp. ZB163]|uniref:chromosome segregation SMC family protein n=1 Tax=Devosia sp. ZB163 TaxID=3025938 RepID=UPI00235F720F|nr:AAA family ATPase [Devosia sp. ZB163]MDC9823650.1 AAA family ATPase [Devosia sp. ZB163]
MKFTRLKVTGFKSFCDPTELHLEPGLSGVVGPNGCGKSNLVEALRWVMGESSYKAMRASGMDDVIFSGSGSRPGRNTAEVTLVLDNSDRTAPAPLNNADVLEVTRRIERESGSVYRVNGKEVRARDVQLLFADASTGAHSPALVRQGQIGELIAAKPQQRRALLEEAAGISGLHSRRHEAELRLRAAEQNLERVDDVIAQVEQQLETLKRQARLAVRYRALSGDIRKAEATLFHIRWIAARFNEKDAEAAQAKLVRELAEAQHTELEAQKVVFLADKALAPLREAEAAAGAALQRLTILAEQLDNEAKRAEARLRELDDRLKQIEQDAVRERTLVVESDEALMSAADEKARLEDEAAGEQQALEEARAIADVIQDEVALADAESRAAAEALAQLRARRAAAERSVGEARSRAERLESQVAEVVREAEQVARMLGADATLTAKREALEGAQAKAKTAESDAIAAESAASAAQVAADAIRPALQQIEASLTRLEAEAQTLNRILNSSGAGKWPAVVDQLKVAPGYETALGAALGDDLDASTDARAPLHWAGAGAEGDPALPAGATPLSRFVSGSPLLARRLDQIGIVEAADGAQLMAQLQPGQRLVSKQGALWRWDGFIAAADAPTAAAEKLAQRNRLAEIEAEIGDVRTSRNTRKADAAALAEALATARNDERNRREAWRLAQREIAAAQAEVDKAQRAISDLAARQAALEETRARLEAGRAEAAAAVTEAERHAAEAGDETEAATLYGAKQAALAELRRKADDARLKLGGFETAARMRTSRLSQIASDSAAWTRRRESAAAQLATLDSRTGEVREQIAALQASPEALAERRRELDAQIATAREAHQGAADALSVGDTRHREADKAQRLAHDALSGFRAELARVEERIKGLIAQRHQIERQVHETLNVEAGQTAQLAGIKPEHALPQESQVESQVERLKAERERLGGVNLGAEKESEEVREKLDLMVKDRDDLIAAIAKLRGGIQSLNREGRQRLNEAFEKVNAHFQELFTSLFGGGTAELQFVESDDPLEAGLEIIARPPGKKPSTMTLLSGGEQALTAMSLIFAVFLTNPAPICVLDEVDAPLDDANVERFCNLLDTMTQRTETRFLVITHNPITMARVDRLFGVTMAERGVSQLVSVDLKGAEAAVRQAS